MKKKILITSLVGALLSGTVASVASATALYQVGSSSHVNVYVNDQLLQVDQNALIKDGRTLVPLRAIFEGLGATIQWDNATQTVTATKADTNIVLKINSNNATVNDQSVALDVPAAVINDRTMVPVRFVSEALGAKVAWDSRTDSVFVIQRTVDNIKNIGSYSASILSYTSDFSTQGSNTDTILAEYINQQLTYDQFKSQYEDCLAKMKADIDSVKATTVPDDPMAQTYSQKIINLLQEGYDILTERDQAMLDGSVDKQKVASTVNDVQTMIGDSATFNKYEYGDITLAN